jgi:hypothetical protein
MESSLFYVPIEVVVKRVVTSGDGLWVQTQFCTGKNFEILSSKLVEMDRSSLPIEVEEGLGRRSAVAEAILWDEQETEIVMFAISCLLLANYESLQL